ncbi:MAG TPA: sugar ABC transporter substrate-binding protein [Spirochaetia bacterium]|nr:sugar ABC transporter substrate-binding protein [Spirochaetia bacterium]
MKGIVRVLACALWASLFLLVGAEVFAGGKTEATTGTGNVAVNIALPNNPISQALSKIAAEKYKVPGVTVNIAVLPENDLRQKLTTEASTGGTTYDIFVFGPYEAQTWAKNRWLENMEPYFKALPADKLAWYDRPDQIQGMIQSLAVKGQSYAMPFYGESSFTMYNKELFAAKGLTMPDHPTWDQIYDLAVKINDPSKGIVGMTMRGAPGWGMSGAPFVTIVNAFGGRFYDMKWHATVDTPEQRAAWQMYKKILRDAGQKDILSYTYNECIALMKSGKAGIYYDATSIAPPLEAADSPVRGKIGYAFAPHEKLETNTAWLWNWAMGINPKSSDAKKKAAFDFILWATSKDYIQMSLALDPSGASTPPGSRSSTYTLPAYASVPYAAMTVKTLQSMDFTHPTLQPVPYVGLQYIAIPEFADAGTKMTQLLADYVVDKISLDQAIKQTNDLFNQVAKDGGYQE